MTKPDKTIKDFHPAVLSSFHDYIHGTIDRRGFLKQVSRIAALAWERTVDWFNRYLF